MFNIGISRDVIDLRSAQGLDTLDEASGVSWKYLDEDTEELRADQIDSLDALLLGGPNVTRATLNGVDRLAVISRFGVGYDRIDVEACTESGVMLSITPDAVRRPVASSAVTFILALSHNLLHFDRLTRAGRWSEKFETAGVGLVDRVLGLVGLGNIGTEIVKLATPFDMRFRAYDPYVSADMASAAGVELVDLDELLRTSDFVCVSCALTPETRNLLDASKLALMKDGSFFINVARGPIVDQRALTEALRAGRIRGAGLDVFEEEPVDPGDPLLRLDNTIVSPHCLCLTDQCSYDIGQSAIASALAVASGGTPAYVVNREVLDNPKLQEKLRRFV